MADEKPAEAASSTATADGEQPPEENVDLGTEEKKKLSCLVIYMCIWIPPIGLYMGTGVCDMRICICYLLSMLGGIPGTIYALWVLGCFK